MLKIVSCAQMRYMDNCAISKIQIPGAVLMENAATGVMNRVKKHFKSLSGLKAAIFCGKGNNGGDGYAIARHLYNSGADVTIYAVFDPDSLTGDAALNYSIIKNMGIHTKTDLGKFGDANLIIDAVFGTGIKGEIEGAAADAIRVINLSNAYKIAVDIPSGVNGDSGMVCGCAVKADETVTFGYIKTGLLAYPAPEYTGRLSVHDISIPAICEKDAGIKIYMPEENDISSMLPDLKDNENKGSVGKALIIAGSIGMSGAAAMAVHGALRTGAGLVYACIPDEIFESVSQKQNEAVLINTGEGSAYKEGFEKITEYAEKCGVVAIGPGMGHSMGVSYYVENLIKNLKKPLVIDADGINALASNIHILKEASCPVVLTPHPGEFARMTGKTIEEINSSRLESAVRFATDYAVTVVLKGAHTITALPDGTAYINPTGNSGMAKGGSGDVLTGIITSLVSRGIAPEYAAVCGVYIHGAAGDAAADELGRYGMLPRDMTDCIPKVLKRLKGR